MKMMLVLMLYSADLVTAEIPPDVYPLQSTVLTAAATSDMWWSIL
jgi:hypothetical protein